MPPLLLSIVLPSVETCLLGEIFDFEGAKVYGDEVLKKTDRKILAWMAAADASTRILHGAFPFGTDRNFERPVNYLTVVSHPVRRVVDEHAFILRKKKHPLHKAAQSCGGTPDAFLKVPDGRELLNQHTVALAGPEGKKLKPDDPQLLDIALKNLRERFVWVGCAESLQDDKKELEELAGRSLNLDGGGTVSANPAVETACALDVELYRICREGGWRK